MKIKIDCSKSPGFWPSIYANQIIEAYVAGIILPNGEHWTLGDKKYDECMVGIAASTPDKPAPTLESVFGAKPKRIILEWE